VIIAASVNAGLRRSPRTATIKSVIMEFGALLLQFYALHCGCSHFAKIPLREVGSNSLIAKSP
jgi:hypothetical protein